MKPGGSDNELRDKVMELESALKDAREKLQMETAEAEAYEGLLKLAMEDMRKIYEDLLRTHSQLAQSDKLAAIGMLSAGVIHEINNPLAIIQGVFYILKQELLDLEQSFREQGALSAEKEEVFKKAVESLGQGTHCSESISKIVKDIRVFSRSDRGENVSESINTVLDGVIGIVWNAIKNKVELKKEFGDIPKINCNSQQLGQVFLNLLVNASQAIDGRGVITVKTEADATWVKISISDTGAGISDEVKQRIFEPFFTTKDAETGTGLGLSISADIIKSHAGKLEVESQVGKGTTFIISLPVSP